MRKALSLLFAEVYMALLLYRSLWKHHACLMATPESSTVSQAYAWHRGVL